jgi:hypothetical protein
MPATLKSDHGGGELDRLQFVAGLARRHWTTRRIFTFRPTAGSEGDLGSNAITSMTGQHSVSVMGASSHVRWV